MKFLATESRAIRTTGGKFVQVIKGDLYPSKVVKAFTKNGKAPSFLVPFQLSHIERFIQNREEMAAELGFESELQLAVYKGLFQAYKGDSEALRGMFNGQRSKALKLSNLLRLAYDIEIVSIPHGAQDPLTSSEKVWTELYPITRELEQRIIADVIDIEAHS
jgi:hypothetical protein